VPEAEGDGRDVRHGARLARRADLSELARLAADARRAMDAARGGRCAIEEGLGPPDDTALRAMLDGRDAVVVAGVYEGVVVGIGVGAARWGMGTVPTGQVRTLYVEPGARGVGVGEAVLDALVAWCAARGCRGVDITTLPGDRETKSLLERAGFAARSVVMHRSLRA